MLKHRDTFRLVLMCGIIEGISLQAEAWQATSEAHAPIVRWAADLKAHDHTAGIESQSVAVSPTETRSTGKATVSFDLERHSLTIKVETAGLKDVTGIELRVARSDDDYDGPSLSSLYEPKNGPFHGSISKTFGDPAYQEIAKVIANGQAVISIVTKAHPQGEISGLITMRKSSM